MPETYVVAKVLERNGWSNDYGKFISYKLELTDGTVCTTNRKEDFPGPETGEQIFGELQPSGSSHPPKLKKLQNDNASGASFTSGGSTGGSKDFKADPIKLAAENKRSALHAAKDLAVAGKIDVGEIGKNAETFRKWIEQDA